MAATPLDTAAAPLNDASNSSSSFDFNIYDDGRGFGAPKENASAIQPPAIVPPPLLPGGRCNFVDLAQGLGGAQCGCRRFWSRAAAGRPPAADNSGTGLDPMDPNQSGWCMCSHHACFHDHSPPAPPPSGASLEQPLLSTSSFFPPSAPALDTSSHFPEGATTKETAVTNPTTSATPVFEQENKRPRATNRTPLSPVQDATSFQLFSAKDRSPPHENDRKTGDFLHNLSFDFSAGLPAGTSAAFPTGFSTSIGPSFADLIAGATDDPGPRAIPPAGDRNPSVAASCLAPVPPAPPSVTATSVASSVSLAPADGGSIPDTMSWAPNNVGLSPGDTGRTRPPSAFSTQQAPPSVASSTSQRYLRPFAGRGLHTLKHAAASTSLLKALPPPPEHAVSGIGPGAGGGPGATPRTSASSISIDRGDAHNSLSSAVQAHETRLEKLENPSFSFFPGHEECQDKHDHIDMRVTELESRVDEVEKRLNNNDDASTTAGGGSIVFTRHRLLGSKDDDDATTASALSTSISSRVSAAADAAAAATSLSSVDRAEIFSQLQSLQTQISLLQSASLPSYNSPWELEVVFLLFPLKGIWVEASQFPTTSAVAAAAAAQRRQAGGVTNSACEDDEWTQISNTLSRQTQEPQPPGAWGAATATDWRATTSLCTYSDAPRLLPRAYAPGRVIDKRLKSRGLVQTLSVRGADARSLQLAIASAFGHVFQALASSSRHKEGEESAVPASPTTADTQNGHFLGLQHPWVPLRKVHKDSRLRFLTRAEMLTPAMWDASFLTSSVVMKGSGLQRLYITHPDAYMQDRHAYRCGWSWQRLREMGRLPENSSASKLGRWGGGSSNGSNDNFGRISSVGGGADETCWAWDSRLDDPPSQSSPSLSSRYRPSASPFSRGATPTSAARADPIHRAANQESRNTAATGRDRPFPTSQLPRASSGGVSGSAQQFFTVGQSLVAADHPTSSPILRRSMSPFSYSLPPHSRRLTPLAVSRPPPLRTVSMPAPPAQGRGPSPMAMAVLSPIGRRRVRSDGSRVRPSSSSHHSTRGAAHDELGRPSTFITRPSPSATMRNNDTIHSNNNASGSAVVSGGIHKPRRSTRSPSVNWARNTPRRSMSRSSSVVHAAPTTAWAVEKPARGSTPFCYATPYSNAPAADPPVSSSSSARRLWHRDHRGQSIQAIDPYDANDYYDDHQMLGYDSEEDLDLDYPMTQDDDEIEVFEDEADDLDDLEDLHTMETAVPDGRRVYQNNGGTLAEVQERQGAVLPEDEPWPGIEEDDNNEHRHGYASAHSHSQGDTQGHGDDSEGTSSDSENVDPVPFDAEMGEAGVTSADGGRPEENLHDESNDINDNVKHDTEDNEYRQASPHSDVSSQPSEYPVSRHAWQASQGRGVGGDGAFPADTWGHTTGGKDRLLRDYAFGALPPLKSGTEVLREGSVVDADMEFQIHEDGDAAVGDF